MIYDILIEKLKQHGYKPGTDLFIGTVPGPVSRAVMLRTPLSGIPIDPFIPGRYRGQVMAVVRHASANEGQREAERIGSILTVTKREIHAATATRGVVHLDLCQPKTLPVQYPRLDGNLIEWSQGFDIVWGQAALSQ